jgi:nucleoside-diphosphate kinase
MKQRTLAIIKPDSVGMGVAGAIISRWEIEGFKIVALKVVHMTQKQAEGFYHVHRRRDFFRTLTKFMSSGPCVVAALEGEGVISRYRKLMGATNPAKAAKGTLRKKYGANTQRNAVHGSDAPDTAAFEIGYFFNSLEIVH